MGLRKYKREIAKARMKALGVDRVNKRMGVVNQGVVNWKRALYGDSGEAGRRAQRSHAIRSRRKIRKISA